MKSPLRFLFASVSLVIPLLLSAAPVKVLTGGSVAQIAGKFPPKADLEFVPIPAGEFVRPGVTEYAMLDVPKSIRHEKREHNVQVGVVLSAKGAVLATCILSSDCPVLEGAAERQVRATKFSPAKLDGAAVPAFLVFPVSYRHGESE
ncbi:MAG TPA: energy transducer TonB [Opitutaceae bacterium]|nr:energy transducer TonB [Opitutaceae bacterium]